MNVSQFGFPLRYYNKWDYDAASGKYLRSSDSVDDPNGGQNEVYAPRFDQLTNEAVAADNVVFLEVPYLFYRKEPEQMEIPFVQAAGF